MANTDSPQKQVFDAIWALLEAFEPFTDLVPEANRLKLEGLPTLTDAATSPGVTPEREPSDVAEVLLRPVGALPVACRTSNGSNLGMRWAIQVRIVNFKLSTLFAVWWAVYRAMIPWKTIMSALVWESEEAVEVPGFVTASRLHEGDEEIPLDKLMEARSDWMTVWTGATDMWFPTADITPP